jgi:hypothetical protein
MYFVVHNLKISHRRHFCTYSFTNSISSEPNLDTGYKFYTNLSQNNILRVRFQWFISYCSQTESQILFPHGHHVGLHSKKNVTLTNVA